MHMGQSSLLPFSGVDACRYFAEDFSFVIMFRRLYFSAQVPFTEDMVGREFLHLEVIVDILVSLDL